MPHAGQQIKEVKMDKLESKVNWVDSFQAGQDRARSEGKAIFLDFFKDG